MCSAQNADVLALATAIYTILVRRWTCGEGACSRDGLIADAYSPAPPQSQTPRDPTVGAGLLAKEASQPTVIYLTPRDPTVGAGLPAKAA